MYLYASVTQALDLAPGKPTRRPNPAHIGTGPSLPGPQPTWALGSLQVAGLPYADECTPGDREPGTHQNIVRTVAERAAIFAHLDAERADFMIARGIEQSVQGNQSCGDIVHRRLATRFVIWPPTALPRWRVGQLRRRSNLSRGSYGPQRIAGSRLFRLQGA